MLGNIRLIYLNIDTLVLKNLFLTIRQYKTKIPVTIWCNPIKDQYGLHEQIDSNIFNLENLKINLLPTKFTDLVPSFSIILHLFGSLHHKMGCCSFLETPKMIKKYQNLTCELNPFPNKPWFLRVCSASLLKTLWEKDELLVTSNSSFSHSVFYPF